ncbi:MAG: CinA family nicotinamide mononucleotide deamidase-related protein [Desulfobacterales bacterium]|jgi:nicotinamide-nucleotide amidase
MQAEILSTGDEVRSGAVVDTNAAYIAEALESNGVHVVRHTCVGDELDGIAQALQTMAGRVELALVTGGLGPTVDDLTAAAAARAAGTRLLENPQARAQVERFFQSKGLAMSDANRKQALLPEGAVVLENPDGSAPGFRLTIGACCFYFLPGVPREMKSMLARHVLGDLAQRPLAAGWRHRVEVVTTFGWPESVVGEKLKGLAPAEGPLRIGLRVRFPEIHVRIYGCDDRQDRLEANFNLLKGAIRERLGKRVLSTSGARLPEVIGQMLHKRGATLALAESCTGGLMSKQLTDLAGSSGFFVLSAVTYANAAKIALLDVAPETLHRWGAVHEATAREMAEGARRKSGADFALSTTGIAGPDGGTEDKPVGTVCIGLATPDGVTAFRYVFPFGDRDLNRRIFAAMAFDRLRLYLLEELRIT